MVKHKNSRYSDMYKQTIHGCDTCGFWDRARGGICKGWLGVKSHACPANEDGSDCPVFPDKTEVANGKGD